MDDDIRTPCADGQTWVCAACGKTSKTKAPTEHSSRGWDASCMLNSVLCHSERGEDGMYRAITEEPSDGGES